MWPSLRLQKFIMKIEKSSLYDCFFYKKLLRKIGAVSFKLALDCSLCGEDKFYGFLPVFSFTIPFEKAREFRKKSGHYLRESQYNDLLVDVYL